MPTPHSPQSTDHFCLPTAVGPGQRITVLGPTASGKTRFAVRLADQLDGEILSVDSRQVYRRMDLGTGKDLDDYWIRGRRIPVHLIDLVEPLHAGDEVALSLTFDDGQTLELQAPVRRIETMGHGQADESAAGMSHSGH